MSLFKRRNRDSFINWVSEKDLKVKLMLFPGLNLWPAML